MPYGIGKIEYVLNVLNAIIDQQPEIVYQLAMTVELIKMATVLAVIEAID